MMMNTLMEIPTGKLRAQKPHGLRELKLIRGYKMDMILYYCGQELELTGVWDEKEDIYWRQDITRKLNGWLNQEVPAFVKNEGNLHGLYVYRPMFKWIQERVK